jgi:hypothetical protein
VLACPGIIAQASTISLAETVKHRKSCGATLAENGELFVELIFDMILANDKESSELQLLYCQ